MKENKKDTAKKGDDLNFVPLNIKEPLKFDNTNIAPSINPDGLSINNSTNYIYIGFPPLTKGVTELPNLNTPQTKAPIMPYPINIPDIETQNDTGKIDLDYPSETDEDSLYSYNKTRSSDDYLYNTINPVDILRNLQLLDYEDTGLTRDNKVNHEIDSIYEKIENQHNGILAALKVHRIPFPLAKLLVKKIIKLTLYYSKK